MATYALGFLLAAALFFAIKKSLAHFRGESDCCGQSSAPPPKKILPQDKIIGEKIVRIDGMSCINCKNRVEFLLNGIDGAAGNVNLTSGTARVKFTRRITDEEIFAALDGSGYNVTKISDV